MKYIVKTWLLVLITSAFMVMSFGAKANPEIGAPAPNFSVIDSHGVTHSLSDFAGETVVLEWTNHDCPYVRKHYESGNMQSLQQRFTEQGVVWLSVISSSPGTQGHVSAEQANELTSSRNAAPTAVLLDESGTMGRAYSARVTPHMYVIDSEGVLQYAGGIDSIPSARQSDIERAEPYFANAAEQVLSGEAVSRPISRPYGCSVKYSD
ncbi:MULTISPECIES: redoxin domain-containing protein [Gammaproteobacteria]|uniref:redoxin domain-containing protein n=1 Tax=Gammaproteobacteria TaxID=1236 RepID=UPI001A9F7120|nr:MULTISPECIES: redoxin domain-containing protein [Gammaproteobacteria]